MNRLVPASSQTSIPSELVEHLHYVELYTSRVIRNALMGDYRSRVRGHGFNFDEHKPYQKGDDFRQIDWNVLARLQELFVKKNLEDKELDLVIVADVSGSMDFATNARTKKERVLEMAATLAFSAVADQIGVGILAFADRVEDYLAPGGGRRQAWKVLERLWSLRPKSSGTCLNAPLEYLNAHLKKASLIFFLSDFVARDDILVSPYLRMIVRKHDFVPIVIEDRVESGFPTAKGFLRLREPERGRALTVRISPRNRQLHQQQVESRRSDLQSYFYRLGLDHLWLQTDQGYINPLLQLFLNRRRGRKR